MATSIPPVLQVAPKDGDRYDAPHPADDPEGRNIVFSGQLLAQMIMAADHSVQSAHDVKSIHTVFSRAGTYEFPMDLRLDTTHAGRNWGSTTITAWQNERLLSRGLLLLNAYEDDFISHSPQAPDVPGPDSLDADEASVGFPGSESRTVPDGTAVADDGSPVLHYWVRAEGSYDSVAANQAILSWSQPGPLIGLAFRPHPDVDLSQAHKTLSTGVIAHTAHFHERFDVGEWMLVRWKATYTGHGRVHGSGEAFTQDGRLASTFSQDSMVRQADRALDPSRSM